MRGHLRRQRFLAAALAGAALASLGVAGGALSQPAGRAVVPGANGRIVYQATVGDHVQLFAVQPDGSDVRQLTHLTDSDAVAGSWSPDAKRIVFERDFPDDTRIEEMRTDGTHVQDLTPPGLFFTPAVAPNGHAIVLERATDDGDGVWIMGARGRHLREITHNDPPAVASQCGCDESPVFSPDGKQIAFVRVIDSQTTAVFVVDRSGRNLRQLTPWSLGVSAKLDWAPDGTRLLVSSPQAERPGTASNLIAIRVADGAVTQLTHDTAPGIRNLADSYSPDGTRLVFARGGTDGLQLWVARADGTQAAQITHGHDAHWATWGPQPRTPAPAALIGMAPVELASSNFNTPAGKLSALRPRVRYGAGSFPLALRVTPPDGTWAGSQWTTSSGGKPDFGWVELGHGGTTANAPPRGGITIVSPVGPSPSVKATIARLRTGGSGATYGAPKAVRIGGYAGLRFDGTVFGKFGHSFVAFSKVTHGASPSDSWHLLKGESFRAIAISVRGRTVVLFLESFDLSAHEFAAFAGSANRLLAGLRFPR